MKKERFRLTLEAALLEIISKDLLATDLSQTVQIFSQNGTLFYRASTSSGFCPKKGNRNGLKISCTNKNDENGGKSDHIGTRTIMQQQQNNTQKAMI